MEDLLYEEDESYSSLVQDFSTFSSLSSADYLLGEEALFREQLCYKDAPFCTPTCSSSSFSQDELGDLFDLDFPSFWTQLEEEDAHRESKEGDCEKALIESAGNVQPVVEIPPGRRGRGSSEKKELTFEQVSRHFSMPIKQAARELNVGVTILKKQCRKLGIARWPHRKVKSLQTLIDNVQELGKKTELEDGHLTRSVVELLQQTKKLIEERPDVALDQRTKELRQACFKESFKRRRIIGHGTW